MSKQSDAKAAQGYVEKPIPRTCANCQYFRSDMLLAAWMIEANRSYSVPRYSLPASGLEKNRRCDLGGFAVKKTATCNSFAHKDAA